MKCFVAVLLLALFAMVMAEERIPAGDVILKTNNKVPQVAAARDKRGLVYGSAYAPLSYAAPYPYSYNLPYAYSSYPSYASYSSYPSYPSYYRYPYYSSPYVVV